MKLSDAIEKGAMVLRTRGPSFEKENDCWCAAYIGLTGILPVSTWAINDLYHDNPWQIKPGSDLEIWLRLVVISGGYRWADVIKKLREYGA